MIINLSDQSSIIRTYVTEIRDKEVQQDRMRFRKNMFRIGQILAYEISKQLLYKSSEIETVLDSTDGHYLDKQPVLTTILRAGLALHEGFLDFYDHADAAYVSAYRKHDEEGGFSIELDYVSCPEIAGRTLILSDPMLATGASIVATLKQLYKIGRPEHTYIATAIASEPGINHVLSELDNVSIFSAAIDKELNDKSYIVPGLGDAGDLAYGPKIQD